jgi:hypothetical protein
MRIKLFVASIFILSVAGSAAVNAQIKSIYTDIDRSCKTIESSELDTVRRCPGVGGYSLLAGLYDERFDMTVVSPGKKEFDQNYKALFNGNFSDQVTTKAEWRVKTVNGKAVPFALIVRIGVQEDAMVGKETGFLAVSKITGRQICVVDKIAPGPGQNEKARQAADASATKPCLL